MTRHDLTWRPTAGERFAYRAAGVILLLAAVFLVRIGAWLAFPGPGLSSVTMTPARSTIPAGEALGYAATYCQPGGRSTVLITRELELDDHGINFPLIGSAFDLEPNCQTVSRVVGIPSYVHAGPYRLKVTTVFHANPLRTIRQEWRSPVFQVTK